MKIKTIEFCCEKFKSEYEGEYIRVWLSKCQMTLCGNSAGGSSTSSIKYCPWCGKEIKIEYECGR